MQRKNSGSPGYDYSRVGYARRHAIKTLDDYNCSSAEIMGMFGVSKATFYRYDCDVRLTRRPIQTANRHSMPPQEAREIATISLIRADYEVKVIAEALGTSVTAVYRERTAFLDRLGDTSSAERRQLHRYLRFAIRDTRSWHQKKVDARRRSKRWRRGVSRTSS